MAWVDQRAGANGKSRYTGMYRDLSGRHRSAGTFTTEKKARDEAVRAEGKIAAGQRGDSRRGRQTLRRFVEEEWLPNHVMEAKTRENYTYLLNRYVLPELGKRRMAEILPGTIRDWVKRMETVHEANPPTIVAAKVVIDAIFTTAFNDQVTSLHPGKGVRTPPVARKPKKIISSEQFDRVYAALGDPVMQLLVEVDIESGLRWGELTELRVKDFDQGTGIITVARAVVQLQSKDVPLDARFVVKNYPKDREWREVQLPKHVAEKVCRQIPEQRLGPDDLIFTLPVQEESRRLSRPAELPDPESLGLTEPNEKGRQYRHGTATAYGVAKCRCQHCKDAVAAYRASRRAAGKDSPRSPRTISSDGHIPANWFRRNVWNPALKAAEIGVHITPHGMRHAHASWLLAGGADLQVVKERLGHGSITTTEKYLHTLPGAHDAALAALDVVRGRAGTPESTISEMIVAGIDERDTELTHLRAMVDQFRSLLGEKPGA